VLAADAAHVPTAAAFAQTIFACSSRGRSPHRFGQPIFVHIGIQARMARILRIQSASIREIRVFICA
jgi:hypothetical protein